MLHELHISGLGVIDDLDLELHPGLNVLTGETGAGKTMVTVGLALALGRRASARLVRQGARAASVEARFDAPKHAVLQGWTQDGDLVLSRTVNADGRSTARIGARLAPVSALAELGEDLVEMHGQHEGTSLLSSAAQTSFLDRFAGPAHGDALQTFREEHERLRAMRRELLDLSERERDRARELDLLTHQVREIEAADPRPGELAELGLEEARLGHAERLRDRAGAAERSLADDDAGTDALRAAAAELRAAAELDPGAESLAAAAAELAASAVELARDVRTYREDLERDPARLEAVRQRIAALTALLRKLGGTEEEEVLALLERSRRRAEQLAAADEERSRLAAEVGERDARVGALAAVVSDGRAAAAPRLAAALRAELRDLGMKDATIEVVLVPGPEPSGDGAERAELWFSGGRGQPRLPFGRVASGGELSRTMLACRSVLVDLDDVPTLVFDEVDAGIGGRAGVAVGRRLAELARTRQVLVVTHLPQIASFADRHVRIEKRRGTAGVSVLDDAGRVDEIARMLAGLPGSEAAATHAEELLAEADRAKARR